MAALFVPNALRAPWLGNMVTKYGVLSPGFIPGDRPILLGPTLRLALGALVFVVAISAIAAACRMWPVWSSGNRGFGFESGRDKLRDFWWIALPFSAAYLGVFLLRSLYTFYTDRYLLPIVAIGLIAVTAIGQRIPGKRQPIFAWSALLIFGLYAIATTHDAYRMWAARLQATDELARQRIPRECIEGGYEYDGWTELEDTDHIIFLTKAPERSTPVQHFFLKSTPHVKPKYYLVSTLQPSLPATPVLDIPYTTWLAPRQHVFVQADSTASCAAPAPSRRIRP
jgi:hypothetical protein